MTKELIKEHALTRKYIEDVMKEIKEIKLDQAEQEKDISQMKQDQGQFQHMVLQTFQQIEMQIHDINTTLKQNLETQNKIQETMAFLINKRRSLIAG